MRAQRVAAPAAWRGRPPRRQLGEYEARRGERALVERLGMGREADALGAALSEWLGACSPEMRGMARYELSASTTYSSSLVVFACSVATDGEPTDALIPVAVAAELLYHQATIVDDIVGRHRLRRGRAALHCRFGRLPALMAAGYLAFSAAELIADDAYRLEALAQLGMELSAVEARRWQLRHEPFGLESWRGSAGAASGAVLRAGARLATRDESLEPFATALGLVGQAAEDVIAVRAMLDHEREVVWSEALVTLPAALATEDADARERFMVAESDEERLELIADVVAAAVAMLDRFAHEAIEEARAHAVRPEPLVELVRFAREAADG